MSLVSRRRLAVEFGTGGLSGHARAVSCKNPELRQILPARFAATFSFRTALALAPSLFPMEHRLCPSGADGPGPPNRLRETLLFHVEHIGRRRPNKSSREWLGR